jgi:hypothetical protein
MPRLLQHRATDAEFAQVQRPGRVVVANQLTAQIVRDSIGTDSRITKTLKHMLGDIFATFMHGHRPQQFIELSLGMAATPVPSLDALPGSTVQRHPPTCIHAVTRQLCARQTEHLAEVRRHRRIALCQSKQIRIAASHWPAGGIEALMRDPRFERIDCLPSVVLHRPDRQASRIHDGKGRRAPMWMFQDPGQHQKSSLIPSVALRPFSVLLSSWVS